MFLLRVCLFVIGHREPTEQGSAKFIKGQGNWGLFLSNGALLIDNNSCEIQSDVLLKCRNQFCWLVCML